MVSIIFWLIMAVISTWYGYLLYRGLIDFSGFSKKEKDHPIYTDDLKGKALKEINSRVYAQFGILFICWPLFLIKNPYHFITQLLKHIKLK